MFKIYGFDEMGGCPLILAVESFKNAMAYMELELRDFGNAFLICRFDVYAVDGFVCRRNIQCDD